MLFKTIKTAQKNPFEISAIQFEKAAEWVLKYTYVHQYADFPPNGFHANNANRENCKQAYIQALKTQFAESAETNINNEDNTAIICNLIIPQVNESYAEQFIAGPDTFFLILPGEASIHFYPCGKVTGSIGLITKEVIYDARNHQPSFTRNGMYL